METFSHRRCPYCGLELIKAPYWRHLELEHPDEYNSDKATWIQLYNDYLSMGMDSSNCIQVISELFNQSTELITDFLKESGVLK
jgi:hypothetical protein